MSQNLLLRVANKRLIAESVVLIDLKSGSNTKLPAFSAGSHLQFELPGGLKRAYSLCNAPNEGDIYQIAVQLEPASRGGSLAVHKEIHVGDVITASLPQNLFPLDETVCHSILIAGGIGITPLISMAKRLESISKSWELHYATRTVERCAFKSEIESGFMANHTQLYFDQGGGPKLDFDELFQKKTNTSHVYVCGPSGFIDLVLTKAKDMGWTSDQLHYERFGSNPLESKTDRAFKVVLARSGMTLEVPVDRSVMHVVLDAGIDLPVSCEQGICGTCITDVISGRPDHRDQCLDDSLRMTSFTPCCSRSLDDELIIDL